MKPAELSVEQRWLMRGVGPHMVWCLLEPAGTASLMQSQAGSTAGPEHAPAWLRDGGYQCGRGRIVSPFFGDPRVVVTAEQINRYGAALPDAVLAELRGIRVTDISISRRESEWCWCGAPEEGVSDVLCRSWNGKDHRA